MPCYWFLVSFSVHRGGKIRKADLPSTAPNQKALFPVRGLTPTLSYPRVGYVNLPEL